MLSKGMLRLNTEPVLCGAFVTGAQAVIGNRLVLVMREALAPLNGHFNVRIEPLKLAFNKTGAAS